MDISNNMKICRKCNIEMDIDLFDRDKSKKDGHKNSCKLCKKAYSKKFYEENRESNIDYSKKYYKDNSEKISKRRKNSTKDKKCNGQLNYGWDMDHIVPMSSAKTEEEVIRLNNYLNFQPLCSYVNRVIKKDRIIYANG
jgi:hypothetical protein